MLARRTVERTPAADFVALGGWKDPACNTSLPKVVVGISRRSTSPGTSLKDYIDGTQAAVVAFNGRGGINGRCLDLKVCDGKFDGPTELSCARQETEDTSVVAGLASTFSESEADAYQLFESAGLSQIGAQVTPRRVRGIRRSAYEFTMGGSGTLLAGMPALEEHRRDEVRHLRPRQRTGRIAGRVREPARQCTRHEPGRRSIQIPPTAVEFTQFVLAAENAGAEGGVLALPGNVASQIIDAADSLNSPLKLSSSWGTFSRKGVPDLPEAISKNMAFTDAVPPAAPTRRGGRSTT